MEENGSKRIYMRRKKQKSPCVSGFVGNTGILAVLAAKGTGNPSPTSKKDSLSTVSLVRESFVSFHSPYGLRPETKGLSHGLKIARQLSIFTPVCGPVPPFQVPPLPKEKGHPFGCPFLLVRVVI